MIDPTMYMKAMDNLNAIKRLAHVAVKLKAAYRETYKAVLETALKGFMTKPADKL
jgi:hypothetical protein